MLKSYSTRTRLPKKGDANRAGYVFARVRGGLSYSGVEWDKVSPSAHERWAPDNDEARRILNRGR